MRANRRPRRNANWRTRGGGAPASSYHDSNPARGGRPTQEPEADWTRGDGRPPIQGGTLAVPVELARAADPASPVAPGPLETVDLGGLLAARTDIVDVKQWLDLHVRPPVVPDVDVVQTVQVVGPTGGPDSPVEPTWSQPTTPGNTLIAVCIGNRDGGIEAQTSGWSSAFTTGRPDAVVIRVFVIPNAARREGTESFTLNLTGSMSVRLYEVSGLDSIDKIVSVAPLGTGSTVSSGSVTPTTPDTWLLAVLANADETTTQGAPDNGFNTLHTDTTGSGSTHARGQVVDRLVTDTPPTAYSTSATLSAAQLRCGGIISFKLQTQVPTPPLGVLRVYAAHDAAAHDEPRGINSLGEDVPFSVPTGTILDFAGTQAPDGFLLCNGQAVSRTTYARLFGVIGTTYGAGDGSTTFNVPDAEGGRFLRGLLTPGGSGGSDTHSHGNAGTHTHPNGGAHTHGTGGPSLTTDKAGGGGLAASQGHTHDAQNAGDHGHAGVGDHGHGVFTGRPRYLDVRRIIKL